jgi:hypothetical protein
MATSDAEDGPSPSGSIDDSELQEEMSEQQPEEKKSKSASNAKDPNRPRRKKARRACFACQRAHLTCGMYFFPNVTCHAPESLPKKRALIAF